MEEGSEREWEEGKGGKAHVERMTEEEMEGT